MDRYDRVAYASLPIPEADPSRLFALGALFGLERPARWRVLEIGCGAGGHLVPLAARHPDDTWVGFDLASVPVQQARGLAQRLSAPVEVLQLDVCEASAALEARSRAEAGSDPESAGGPQARLAGTLLQDPPGGVSVES